MARAILSGIPVSAGIAIGKAFFVNRGLKHKIERRTIAKNQIKSEQERLKQAHSQAIYEFTTAKEKVPADFKEHELIIESHIAILRDPKLITSTLKTIEHLCINAEWALYKTVQETEKRFASIEDEYIRQRMQDVKLVTDRVQAKLMGLSTAPEKIEGRVILMAYDLSPSDTAVLDIEKVMAFAIAEGGKTSHTGIVARSLQLPSLVGVKNLEQHVIEGELVIIDALKGKILLDPDEAELAAYVRHQNQFENYQQSIIRDCQLPAETIDGDRIQINANVELAKEGALVRNRGGEGIGLLRTEYRYMSQETIPTEEELFEEYFELATTMHPTKIVFRTLDIGGDKFIAGLNRERNPALGMRSIRFCLQRKEMFKAQLKAVLRAGVLGNVSIMYPLISGLAELYAANAVLAEAKEELLNEGLVFNANIPKGIMVEVPALAFIAEIMAKEVDFFSIGTNDLIQYILGVDRTNQQVAHLYQPLHPAVLRAIKHVVDAGHQAGIAVSICGEMASDPFCVPLFMGMQVDSLSMNAQAIPGIKRIIRQTSMKDCKELLRQALMCDTAPATNKIVTQFLFKNHAEELTFFTSLLDEYKDQSGA